MEIPLSRLQREIIIGSILGDGYIEFSGFHGSRLQIKQAERYKDYVFWLFKKLDNLCKSIPKQRMDTAQWYFSTRHLNELTNLRNLFYPKNKKEIPKDISNLLTSRLSLAIWYMDDGRLDYRPKDHYAFILSTDAFSDRDVNRLRKVLNNNFGIISTVQYSLCRGKMYPKLYIGKKGRDRFLEEIKPYILNCFSHKLPPLL